MRDSGLFVSMLEKGTAGEILSGNLGIYKGAIYENIIADAFAKMDRKLYCTVQTEICIICKIYYQIRCWFCKFAGFV